jgi:hypothetical protein
MVVARPGRRSNDIVRVASVSTRPAPRNPGRNYTTTHFDMWRSSTAKPTNIGTKARIAAPCVT